MSDPVWVRLLDPDVLGVILVIICAVGIITAATTIGIVKMVHKHSERMAMIEHGIDPDSPPEQR
jgi:hypothetical protein